MDCRSRRRRQSGSGRHDLLTSFNIMIAGLDPWECFSEVYCRRQSLQRSQELQKLLLVLDLDHTLLNSTRFTEASAHS